MALTQFQSNSFLIIHALKSRQNVQNILLLLLIPRFSHKAQSDYNQIKKQL